ncbi:phosphatidylinositol-specific phospholipase C1-like protein, partial [Xanthomonas translucens pv. translucens]
MRPCSSVSPALETACPTLRPASRLQRTQRALLALLTIAPLALHAAPRLNALQYIGSHNSYHAGFAPSEAALWHRMDPAMFALLDYRHPPLTQQLDDGVRQIELDIYADAKGGRYAHPAIVDRIAKAGLPPAPAIAAPGVMEKPGFKVMHVQDLDQRSTCQPLRACLQEVRAWSRQHPGHVPVFVLLETKQSPLQLDFATVQPEPFGTEAMDALDAELRSVFKPGEYL